MAKRKGKNKQGKGTVALTNPQGEKVKLDEMLKDLFSASHMVLVKLLNGLFNQDFREEDVEISLGATEFITDSDNLGVIRADMFFEVRGYGKPIGFHIEFQVLNDGSMVIRTLKYGLMKAIEKRSNNKDVLVMPHQKVIYLEKNDKIPDKLEAFIVFPDGQEVNYEVEVMKYWEYSEADLLKKKLYPLLPLQLFTLRKELQKAYRANDKKTIQAFKAKIIELARELAKTSVELQDDHEIISEDLHKILIAINNLVEFLNRNYIKDDTLEEEVKQMTRTLYDPVMLKAFEEQAMQVAEERVTQAKEEAKEEGKIESAISLLDVLDDQTISAKLGLSLEMVQQLREDHS